MLGASPELLPPACLHAPCAQGSGLPSMLQSKLNAPRVLRVNKVADYIIKKMADQGLALREEPLFWDAAKQQEWEAQQAQQQAAGAQQQQPQQDAAGAGPGPGPPNGSGSSRFSIRQLYGGSSSAAAQPQSHQVDLPLLITCNGMVRQSRASCCRAGGGGQCWDSKECHEVGRAPTGHRLPDSSTWPVLLLLMLQVVPWDFSLAAVKQWIWKRSDDLVRFALHAGALQFVIGCLCAAPELQRSASIKSSPLCPSDTLCCAALQVLNYSVRNPHTPLRLPKIRAPV